MTSMQPGNMLYFRDRDDWRKWLEVNHNREKEVWLVYYKVHTGKPSISYEDSVEEAICFAWIDSIVRRLDDEKYIRKFIPRRKNSHWSESNKNRSERMFKEGRMTQTGLVLINEAKHNGEWYKARHTIKEPEISFFFEDAIAKNKEASDYFNTLAPSYRRDFF